MVDRMTRGASLRSCSCLLLCLLALATGCNQRSSDVPADDDGWTADDATAHGGTAKGDKAPFTNDAADTDQNKLDIKDIPERLLEPDMQLLVQKVEAWGGTTDAELGKLLSIHLDNTRIEDRDLREISSAVDLQELTLSNTRITDQGLAELVSFKSLRQLDCAGTKVSDAGMNSIAKLSNLWRLRLSNTSVSDQALPPLTQLKKLDVLSLDETQVTNAGLAALLEFPLLKSVNLKDTNIDDGSIATLKRLKTIEILNIEKTDISDKGVQQLRSALGANTKIFAHDGTFVP